MKVNDYVDFKIVILETSDEDVSLILNSYDEVDLIYVPMRGYVGEGLILRPIPNNKSRRLVLQSSVVGRDLFDSEEQSDYVEKCCRKFWESGKQMIIENYDYQEDKGVLRLFKVSMSVVLNNLKCNPLVLMWYPDLTNPCLRSILSGIVQLEMTLYTSYWCLKL